METTPRVPPEMPRTGKHLPALYAGVLALVIFVAVALYNIADVVEQRRHNAQWKAMKQEQAARLELLRGALSPGGYFHLEAGRFDEPFAVAEEAAERHGRGAGTLTTVLFPEMARVAASVRTVNEALTASFAAGTFDLDAFRHRRELAEQEAALRAVGVALEGMQANVQALPGRVEAALAARGLSEEERAGPLRFVEEALGRERAVLLALGEELEKSLVEMRAMLAILDEQWGEWHYEVRTGFPVFEDDPADRAFARLLERALEPLGEEERLRSPYLRVD